MKTRRQHATIYVDADGKPERVRLCHWNDDVVKVEVNITEDIEFGRINAEGEFEYVVMAEVAE